MRAKATLLLWLFSLASTLMASELLAQVQGSYRSNVSIESWIERIKSEPDHIDRAGLARRMAYDIATLKPAIASDTLDEIISLLNDESDLVRTSIANSLGRIGPPAVRAVPALEMAFAKGLEHIRLSGIDGVVVGGSYSVDAICGALDKIGSASLPQGCRNGSYYPP